MTVDRPSAPTTLHHHPRISLPPGPRQSVYALSGREPRPDPQQRIPVPCRPRKASIRRAHLFPERSPSGTHPQCTANTLLPRAYNSLLPSIAFCIVTSSAYSISLPTGTPVAMRVTFTDADLNNRER